MIRRAGEHGLLVETGALEVSHRLDAALRDERPPEVLEVVPGPETVLVVAPGADQARLRELLERLAARCRDAPPGGHGESGGGAGLPYEGGPGESGGGSGLTYEGGPGAGSYKPGESGGGSGSTYEGAGRVTVPVTYDGADLESVAEAAGISVDEVVARHTGRELVVGWLGFAPGFAYLIGLDPVLHMPRLATPRTSVPAGSVAIAGPYSAVYPTASPGGWRLLGRTDARVWDVSAEPPTPFRPGTRVRFEVA
ncbi:allophanate hydrolase subunit 1 [Nonomuraea sp. MCN248]|uniref:Allophanate hydrolase subunit 1 n=1 Tax=Nonomuraea corallina TaxID=2989783 RepID=A0ABT4S5J2_9ACTN|nr:allophanate hydrolase subunit 1 [Nonomuraea corallina]MDA0632468.1 allophanate hydrolase subunit 1 [Nonomuraea corallina]